ncbi:hypothetical protein ACFQO7_29470 [Catellatospora aurea]|uniref:DUF1963 domain-containing protein n=1 Tax=Catellatospora aurea TaxID=1337874 RepID=A0ABW2H2Z4_9ACTN
MHTPALPADALAALPGLAAFGRTATRLHPRRGTVTAADSHVGGPLRWPAGEPWPLCEHPYMVNEEVPLPQDLMDRLAAAKLGRTQPNILTEDEVVLHEELAALVGPGFTSWGRVNGGQAVGHRFVARPHDNPMLAVAQLRAADVPDLPTPDGADLLQVLWCPFGHEQEDDSVWGPTLRLVWRREADVTGPLATAPDSAVGEEWYVPQPCRLHPEQIVEYPYPQELPEPLREQAKNWPDGYVETFMAPGWKVGGHAKWQLTDLQPTPCRVCAGPTRLLLVIDSSEGIVSPRWRPVEEAGTDPGSFDHDANEPTGVTVGRWGALRVFMCPTCPGAPFRLDQQ